MMPSADVWTVFAGLCAVLVLLGGTAVALRQLGIVRGRPRAVPLAPVEEPSHEERLVTVERKVAVLEERSRGHEEALGRIGRVHARIDDVVKNTSHIDGQLVQLNKSVGLLTQHLLNREGSA